MRTSRSRPARAARIERAKITPAAEFAQPDDVIDAAGIQDSDKKKMLNQWEVDAQALSRASDEGMSGGEPSRLSEVQAARRKLAKNGSDGSSATKDRRTSGKPQP